MDPPIINDTSFSFSAANPSSYTSTGIWPFSSLNGGKIEGLGLKICRNNLNAGFEDGCSKIVSTRRTNHLNKSNGKRTKPVGSNNEPRGSKVDRDGCSASMASKSAVGQNHKPSEPPKDYIHVRARRGQATDSHSLAERARREKISKRMKILQDLVPGCNKVIGKAPVLDEIINYIQLLQHQIEFLSMKLEAVDTRTNSPMEGVPMKDLGRLPFETTGLIFSSQTTRQFGHGSQAEWLHMELGNSFRRTT